MLKSPVPASASVSPRKISPDAIFAIFAALPSALCG